MFFGTNLQYLRRKNGITQEQLALQLGVSRQTVSKWESGQTPELAKLLELSELFSCKLDDFLKQDLSIQTSPVRILRVKGFSMARYVMISPHAQADLLAYFQNWAKNCGLRRAPYISWSYPYLSSEQKLRLGLTGFEAAYVLPENFQPRCLGPVLDSQSDCCYAVLSLPEPRGRQPEQIARGIQSILSFLQQSGISKSAKEGFLPCFELRYEKDRTPYVDIFLQCQDAAEAKDFSFEIQK